MTQSTDSLAHKYLQYAVLRLLEGDAELIPEELPQGNGVTVRYGRDRPMYDSWGSDIKWWETVPPQDECTRFRIFYPDEHATVPRVIIEVMAALGAWRVWEGSAAGCGGEGNRHLVLRRVRVWLCSTRSDSLANEFSVF